MAWLTPLPDKWTQCRRRNSKNIPISMPTRMTVAQIRMSTIAEIGKSGPCVLDGTSGARSPIAVVFRGGQPAREEDACVSGSWSHSPNLYVIRKCYSQPEGRVQNVDFGWALSAINAVTGQVKIARELRTVTSRWTCGIRIAPHCREPLMSPVALLPSESRIPRSRY
jgi:hypothetical protein